MEGFNFTWGLSDLDDLGFVQVYQFMLRSYAQLGITRQEMLVIIHLASYRYNSPKGESRPSLQTIADEMGYGHKNRVSELVNSLSEKKMLIIEQVPGQPSVYNMAPFAYAAMAIWIKSVTEKRDPGITEKRDGGSRKNVTKEEEPKKKKKAEQLPSPVGVGYVVFNLDDVAYIMDGTGHRKQDLEAQCDCGAPIQQTENLCRDCGKHVVWKNSPTWKKLFGNPDDYERKLNHEDLKATTPLQTIACLHFGTNGAFANVTQQRTFKRLERKYPDDFLKELLGWARDKGFGRFESAAENPDNYSRWLKHQESENGQAGSTASSGRSQKNQDSDPGTYAAKVQIDW